MIEQLKRHWVVSHIVVGAIVAAAVWNIAMEVRVAPLEAEIDSLRAQQSNPSNQEASSRVLPPTRLGTGQSTTTSDGICTIGLESVNADTGHMVVNLSDQEPSRWSARAGDTWHDTVVGASYTVFVLDVRQEVVEVSVFRMGEPRTPAP